MNKATNFSYISLKTYVIYRKNKGYDHDIVIASQNISNIVLIFTIKKKQIFYIPVHLQLKLNNNFQAISIRFEFLQHLFQVKS